MADEPKKKKPDPEADAGTDKPAAPPTGDAGMMPGAIPPDFEHHFYSCMQKFMASGAMQQYMNTFPGTPMGPAMGPQTMSMPGATNGMMPAPATYAADADKQRQVQTDQAITAEQYARRLDDLEKKYEAERESRLALEKRERASRYERDLTGLRAAGYQFDLAEEMDLVKDLDDAGFARHTQIIQKRYQRTSTGQHAPLINTLGGAAGLPEGAAPAADSDELQSREEVDYALAYQRDHRVPISKWDECKQAAIQAVRHKGKVQLNGAT